MVQIDEVPTSADNGVTGNQQAGIVAEIAAEPAPPIEGQYLERTVMGLVADRPGKFGGDINAPMLGAMLNDFAFERAEAKKLAAANQAKLDQAFADLNEEKLKNVRLEERLNGSQKSNAIQKVCTFFSPVLGSIAIDLFKANSVLASCLVGAIGVVLLLINFIPNRGKD